MSPHPWNNQGTAAALSSLSLSADRGRGGLSQSSSSPSSSSSFCSSGSPPQFCALWSLLSPLGDEGGCLTSAAHSGRKSLLLLSTVQQNTASIHPWMGSYPVLSHSPTKHNTAQGALSLQEVTAPEGLGLLSPSPDSGPLPQSDRVLLAPEQRAEGQRACRRVRISLLSEDPVPPPAV